MLRNLLGTLRFWPDCKAIPAYGLMMSACLSVRLSVDIWLTFAFKFWNLLCNPATPSSAVSCALHDEKKVQSLSTCIWGCFMTNF